MMKMNAYSSSPLAALPIAALLAVLPSNTFAQAQEALTQATAQADLARVQLQQSRDQAAKAKVMQDATKINTGSRGKFSDSVASGWAWVQTQCTEKPITDQCAAAAVSMASNECSASAKFLKKDAKFWEYLNIGLLIASAASTAVGASPTIANAKIWSTLGGTAGLGAVTASVNANTNSDQIGLTAINTTLNQFITFVTTGSTKGAAAAPVIAATTAASGTAGSAFSFQIVATNSPTSYTVTGLPAGLSVNAASGLISGTPTSASTSTLALGATNASGSGYLTMPLTIAAAGGAAVTPVITSPTAASGTVGSAFSYQIAATNSPASFAATGLPAGLTVSSATGLISGTPTSASTSTVTLGATIGAVTGSATLTLTTAVAAPTGSGPAPNELVFKVASLYGTECAAAAMASSK
jgi:hypothetical protein